MRDGIVVLSQMYIIFFAVFHAKPRDVILGPFAPSRPPRQTIPFLTFGVSLCVLEKLHVALWRAEALAHRIPIPKVWG